jgi:hypothetical protein
MSAEKQESKRPKGNGKPVSLRRHKANCTVCAHEKREEIEARFVNWQSPMTLAKDYGLADRASIYRHAHAFGLLGKRKRNVQAALESIIERASEVEVTAPAVVAAVQAYAKINAQGQWVDRTEHVNLNELFERMTQAVLETYARDGNLPDWFTQTVGATAVHGREAVSD